MCWDVSCILHNIIPASSGQLIQRQRVPPFPRRFDEVEVIICWDAAAPFPRSHGLVWQPKISCQRCHFWPDVRDMLHA